MIDLPDLIVADDETLFERRMRFLTQRNAGGTFREIAEKETQRRLKEGLTSGISPTMVRKDIASARLELLKATREDMIAECASVIYDVRRANYLAMAGGDIDAAKIVLSTVVAQREMFGLDSPKRVAVGVGTDIEFAETLASLIESVGYAPPKELLHTARGDRADRNVIDGEIVPDSESQQTDFDPVSDVRVSAVQPANISGSEDPSFDPPIEGSTDPQSQDADVCPRADGHTPSSRAPDLEPATDIVAAAEWSNL